ncbi:Hypothetical protein R9X50_00257600 [Acrodontium crateriforme]|uniref:BRCT domain-containing protein n=1 Tax=Acrodontium crateriforme TaxID=150365 RepID=A0AAQ3RB40_9PEZI|nr:Hypothetical protein R9X50_00257600 [Acrodontium crateriforme]
MADCTDEALFAGVVFAVIPGGSLDGGAFEQDTIFSLTNNGAHHVPLRTSDNQIDDLKDLTYIISCHIDFPQYNSAIERNVNVVKPSWVAQSIRRSRLAAARQHSPDPRQFFQDVVLTCATLPEGDKDAIIAGVLVLGGQYSSPLTKLVTHIVSTDMEDEKVHIAKEKNLDVKIVLPHWFDHCLRLGKKISERPYMLPNPAYLDSSWPQKPVRPVPSDHVEGATASRPSTELLNTPRSTPPSSPSAARKSLSAFKGKKVMLSTDLRLGAHLLQTLEELITQGGGSMTSDVDETDIYICHYRAGQEYVTASRARKEVANLSWLYYVINQNKYSNPLTKLLHYPVPKGGFPGFENMKISVSNYTGEARIYLENLIKESGAQFTKTMRQDNTHLITAHGKSEKVDAAREWNIHIINHLWLEESYAKCAVQTLSNERYNTFPNSTNLSEIVGQTSLDMDKIEQRFFAKAPATHKPAATKPSPRKTVPASSAIINASSNVARQPSIPPPVTEDAEIEDAEAKPQTAKKPRGRPSKPAVATPRKPGDEKENESPINLSTGRASKVRALDALHQQADDISLFQKEMKRKGGVIHGGRHSSHAEAFTSPAPVKAKGKRKSGESTFDVTAEGSALSDGETQEKPVKTTKKAKVVHQKSLPPITCHMMVTGDYRWVGKPAQEDKDKSSLRQLGVMLTQDPTKVDVLVAPKILRTRKFVSALASAPVVVDTKYLDTALKQDKLIEKPKPLQDRDTEGRFGFKLCESLERARVNSHKLLSGWTIYVTEGINGGFETFEEIIKVNGGVALLYAGRTGLNVQRRMRDPDAGSESQHQGDDDEYNFIYLVSGESDKDTRYWKTFRDMIDKTGLQSRIVSSDWLLNAAMAQQIRWDPKWELREA